MVINWYPWKITHLALPETLEESDRTTMLDIETTRYRIHTRWPADLTIMLDEFAGLRQARSFVVSTSANLLNGAY